MTILSRERKNERDMIFIALAILAAISVMAYVMMASSRRVEQSDDKREIEFLRKARLMFPSAENDIFALDALYQHTFRELLITQKECKPEWEALKRDSVLIFNTKKKAIIDAVRFEERYLNILPVRQGTLH